MLIKNISECAKNIGILFQIKDDLLDYSFNKKMGKPLFQDLKEGKITYPFYFAYKNAKSSEKKILLNFLGNQRINADKVLEVIKNLQGIRKTELLAKQFHKNAIIFAGGIDNLKVKKEMIELTNIAYNRDK